jgi:hypothetical protein
LDAEGLVASITSQPVGPLDDFHVASRPLVLSVRPSPCADGISKVIRDILRKPQFASWAPIQNTSDPHSRAVVTALYNDLFTIPVATLGHSLHKLGLPTALSSLTSQGAYLLVHFVSRAQSLSRST